MRLDLAVIFASIAGALLWIEHGHRIDVETPAGAAFAAPAVCPDSENVPYSATCLTFMSGDKWQPSSQVVVEVPRAPRRTEISAPAIGCPDNDNRPYSAACLAYLRGATSTGMRWRMTAPPNPPLSDAPK